MFYVCDYARYQENPMEPHLTTTKNIFRYLHHTHTHGIWYHVNIGFFIQASSDADLGSCQLHRNNTTGDCQFLDEKLVSWQSKKQTSVSISTIEVKYLVVATCIS